jgi:putative Mg2+ transporter-C (MgtC) family protein
MSGAEHLKNRVPKLLDAHASHPFRPAERDRFGGSHCIQPMNTVPLSTGIWMCAHMAFALLLGWSVGYERYFSGRAAGSQVYCLVSTTACAVTMLAGYPTLWYWGTVHDAGAGDPTRVIGAILTGIGFLGAGIIVQSGLNVRGLTTAATIWCSSAIGILVGTGFYLPSVGLTALFVVSLSIIPRLEHWLPARAPIAATMHFKAGYRPSKEEMDQFLTERGLSIPADSISIRHDGTCFELDCLIFASSAMRSDMVNRIAIEMAEMGNVERFTVSHSSRA